jgi:hypothetical protein
VAVDVPEEKARSSKKPKERQGNRELQNRNQGMRIPQTGRTMMMLKLC